MIVQYLPLHFKNKNIIVNVCLLNALKNRNSKKKKGNARQEMASKMLDLIWEDRWFCGVYSC